MQGSHRSATHLLANGFPGAESSTKECRCGVLTADLAFEGHDGTHPEGRRTFPESGVTRSHAVKRSIGEHPIRRLTRGRVFVVVIGDIVVATGSV